MSERPAGDAAPSAEDAGDVSLLALVDRLAALLERSDLAELEVEAGGTTLVLRAAPGVAAAPAGGTDRHQGAEAAAPTPAGAAHGGRPASPGNAVLAPLTGVFYASPSPGSPPFIEAGQELAVGQVIGLIEAMKLFNEIKSDRAGRVVRVLVENGALVRAKQPLLEVEPL